MDVFSLFNSIEIFLINLVQSGLNLNLLIGVVGILVCIAFLYTLRAILHSSTKYTSSLDQAIFLIKVPKERKGERSDAGPTDDSINNVREDIAIAETLYSSIAGLKKRGGFLNWMSGKTQQVSFEMVVKNSKISFYVACPKKLKEFITQQIHAQYPFSEISEELDYNIFKPDSHIVGAHLWQKHKPCFPIKTYKTLDSDPLLALLNPLSKINEDEGIIIQYIMKPAGTDWAKNGVKIIRDIKKGEKFEYAARRSNFARAWRKWAKFIFRGSKDEASQNDSNERYQLTQMEEEMVKNMEEKISRGGLETTIRLISSAPNEEKAKMNLDNILNAYSQYNIYRYGNSLAASVPRKPNKIVNAAIHRVMETKTLILNTEELASLWHLPMASTETPHIDWLGARKAPPPADMPKEGVIIGRTVYRGKETIVRMRRDDRRRHFYCIGKSGSGKSVLIQNLAVQDIAAGDGVCVVDPHGDFADYVLQHVPKERADDVIYFNPSDVERPFGLNMLEAKTEDQKDFVTQEMVAIFYKLVSDPSMIGPMFEHQMRNVMFTLMADTENPGTIAEIPRMFTDDEFVEKWKKKLNDPVVLAFWDKEMAKTSDYHKSEMLGYLISKVGRFVENSMIRNIIGQTHSSFNFREVMDQKKILIVNLAKGKTGEINSNLLGMIIVSKLQMAAMERADLPEDERHDFYLYIDEFQNFITDSIATILSEARKYRLDLVIAHQYLNQMIDNKGNAAVKDAVLGNVGTMAAYRIGPEDAEILSKEFAPTFGAYDLINAEKYSVYLKLLIKNTASKPFSVMPYAPQPGNKELSEAIKELSRLKYGRPREIVEAEIMERADLGVTSSKAENAPPEPSL